MSIIPYNQPTIIYHIPILMVKPLQMVVMFFPLQASTNRGLAATAHMA